MNAQKKLKTCLCQSNIYSNFKQLLKTMHTRFVFFNTFITNKNKMKIMKARSSNLISLHLQYKKETMLLLDVINSKASDETFVLLVSDS